jgi:hypothetical protein
MIDKYPTIDPSENGSSCDLSAVNLGRLALTPEKIAKMTTTLEVESAAAEQPKVTGMLELYEQDKGQPEHQYIGRL